MSTKNNFIELYQTLSNTELQAILDNPGDYQQLAIEAAMLEYNRRQLTETEILEAKKLLAEKQYEKEKMGKRINAVKTKVNTAGSTFFDTINPVLAELPTPERMIRFIVIIFGGLFLYKFFGEFSQLREFFELISIYPVESILYLLPMLLLGIAVITFWMRKRIGWILLTIYMTYGVVDAIAQLYLSITRPSRESDFFYIPGPSLSECLLLLLFLGLTLLTLSKETIREKFSIDKETLKTTIGLTALLSSIILFTIIQD